MKRILFLALFFVLGLVRADEFPPEKLFGHLFENLLGIRPEFKNKKNDIEKIYLSTLHFQDNKSITYLLPIENTPWVSSHFPFAEGGITYRWDSSIKNKLGYVVDTLDEENKLSPALMIEKIKMRTDLKQLSPVEKLDLVNARYDFPATKYERAYRSRSSADEDWYGFCNGVMAAGQNSLEPTSPLTLINQDEIEITFYPNDLKALASANFNYVYYYASVGKNKSETDNDELAWTLDVLLRFYLKDLGRPFHIDIKNGEQIENATVIGFDRELVSKNQNQHQTILRYKVDLKLLYKIPFSAGNQSSKIHLENNIYHHELVYEIIMEGTKLSSKMISGDLDFIWFSDGLTGTDDIYVKDQYLSKTTTEIKQLEFMNENIWVGNHYINGDTVLSLIKMANSPKIYLSKSKEKYVQKFATDKNRFKAPTTRVLTSEMPVSTLSE